MGELISALKNFISRDLLYVVGGGSVISSFLYLFDRISFLQTAPVPVWLFGAGLAYVLGYAIQEGLSLTGLVTSAYVTQPGSLVRWLYKKFTNDEWINPSSLKVSEAEVTVTAYAPPETLIELRRLVSLRQIGTTMGSCALASSVVLAIRAWSTKSTFDISLAALVFAFAVVLCALGWVKAAQQTQYLRHVLPLAARNQVAAERHLQG